MISDAPVEKKNEFLAPVLSGQHFGFSDSRNQMRDLMRAGCVTVAEKDGDEYILNGMKCFNTNGPLADYTAVYALTEPEKKAKGLSCFVVKKGTPRIFSGQSGRQDGNPFRTGFRGSWKMYGCRQKI